MVLSIEEVLTKAEPNLTNHLVKAILEQTQCPICTDHMFVPVMTKCGHNFCYECITSWLISNDGGATCPACREEIVEPPYFNIQIQELCNQLVSTMGKLREGGVPEFITTDRENKIKKYKRDLKTKKLYNNVFKNSAQAVIDKSDGVARCSNCHWEVEGNYCENCNTRLRNPNRIQEEFQDSDIDSDNVVRYVNGNNDEDDDENSDTQPNSDDADFIDDRPISNLDIYNENSDYSSGGSSPARQTPHYQSGLVEIVNRGGRRNVIPITDSEEEQSDRDAPDYESWNGIHSSSSSHGGSASYQRNDPNSDSYIDSHSDGYRSEGSYNGQYQEEMHQGEDYGHYNQYNRNGYSSEEEEQRGYGHEEHYGDQYHSDGDHPSNVSYYSEENNGNQGQYDNGGDYNDHYDNGRGYRDQDQYYSSSD